MTGEGRTSCPRGHTLVPCAAMVGSCDGCHKLVLDGEPVMDCRSCNFYLCGFCQPLAHQDLTHGEQHKGTRHLSAMCVRNTFIELREERSPSLERAHGAHRPQSCPPGQAGHPAGPEPRSPRARAGRSMVGSVEGAVDLVADELQDAMNQIREQGGSTAMVSNMVAAIELGTAALPAVQKAAVKSSSGVWGFFNSIDNAISDTFDKVADEMKDAAQLIRDQGMARAVKSAVELSLISGLGSARPAEQREAKLRLVEAKLGSAEVPSLGSVLHGTSLCKPCAFAAQSGPSSCKNGQQCQFCHLCDSGERKRRRRTWQKSKREEKERLVAAASVAGGGTPTPMRSVRTAPGHLASMGNDAAEAPAARAPLGGHAAGRAPAARDWAEASGF